MNEFGMEKFISVSSVALRFVTSCYLILVSDFPVLLRKLSLVFLLSLMHAGFIFYTEELSKKINGKVSDRQ